MRISDWSSDVCSSDLPSTASVATGRPKAAKRAGSPLAVSTRAPTCGPARSTMRARIVWPPSSRRHLSPQPMRRERPPASSTPTTWFLFIEQQPVRRPSYLVLRDGAYAPLQDEARFEEDRPHAEERAVARVSKHKGDHEEGSSHDDSSARLLLCSGRRSSSSRPAGAWSTTPLSSPARPPQRRTSARAPSAR